MRLSKRGEYGLRAMIILADVQKNSPNGMIQIKEISAREEIPAKFLEQILLYNQPTYEMHHRLVLFF